MDKPKVQLSGQDGNIFNLIGIACEGLRKAGLHAEVQKLQEEVRKSKSYDEALQTIMKYVDVM